jgi:ankyrin repeat protein
LSHKGLSQAVAVDVGDVNLIKKKMPKEGIMTRVCMGLVVVDRDTSVIRLVHFSMQEYLQKHHERSKLGLIFQEQYMIVKTCLTILLFDEFGKGKCKSDAEFELWMQEYPIFFYAAANWPYHAGSEMSNESGQLALRFLQDKHKVSSATQAMIVDRQYRFKGYSQCFPNKFTGLHMASYHGLKESVESLLASNWEIDEHDSYGRTPLLYAVENGHEAVVKLLLERGAVLKTEDSNYGRTPLSWAAENGHKAVVKLLLEKGAELETKDFSGRTLLSWAAMRGHEAVVKLLPERGAVLEAKSNNNRTPLSYAAENGHEAVVKLLLEKGAELETKDSSGWTLLSYAASRGHEAVVKLLLEKGAELETKDSSGRTPLSWAVENGRKAVVKLLLEKGAQNHNNS